jgi:CheY-like chemotaxis protein
VILDVQLPDIDGYEAARRIAPHLPSVVICLVSRGRRLRLRSGPRLRASAYVRRTSAERSGALGDAPRQARGLTMASPAGQHEEHGLDRRARSSRGSEDLPRASV